MPPINLIRRLLDRDLPPAGSMRTVDMRTTEASRLMWSEGCPEGVKAAGGG
jgi:hypothetical protein